MKISEIRDKLDLDNINRKPIDEEMGITHGYTGDLLSLVLANAKNRSMWLTIQNHLNIIGVAAMAGISAIVVCEGHDVDDGVVDRADDEGVALFTSKESAFILSGKLYELGIR